MFKKFLAFFAAMSLVAAFAAVDVNKGSAAELDGIKGIGPAISAKIVDERKKGDLAQLWVHKFRSNGQLYLLGYTREDAVQLVYLEALGPHENYYRDLKR